MWDEITNMKSLCQQFPRDNKKRPDSSEYECPHTSPVSMRRMIRCYFQHIPIYYFLLPSLRREGESRVMRDIWYKVGTQLRYAIFFFQRTMVRLRRNIFLRRWLDIFLETAWIGPIILDIGMFTMLVCYQSCSEKRPLCNKLPC